MNKICPGLSPSENLRAMAEQEGKARAVRPGRTRQLEFTTQIWKPGNNTENPRDLQRVFLENSAVLISVCLYSSSWKE